MTVASDPDQRRSPVVRRFSLAAAVLCCVVIGLMFPFPTEGRLWGEIFDLAHAPVFCGVLLLVVGICDPPAIGFSSRHAVLFPMPAGRVIVVMGLLIGAGVVVEGLQKLVGRSASLGDVAANSVGLVAGLCWIMRCRAVPIFSGRKYAAAGLALLVLVSVSPMLNVWDCVLQIRNFPMLASFERSRELHNWKGDEAQLTQSSEWATDGKHCGRIDLQPGRYSGIEMVWFARDWTQQSMLLCDLKNPGTSDLPIVIKLYDRQYADNDCPDGHQYDQVTVVPAGEVVSVRIPLSDVKNAPANRSMDLDQMWVIELFTIGLDQPAVLLVDALKLN